MPTIDVFKIIEEISSCLEKGFVERVKIIVKEIDPAVLVDVLNQIDDELRVKILPYVDLLRLGSYITRLKDEVIKEIELYKGIDELVELVNWLPVDEAVDLLQKMNPKTASSILKMISAKRKEELLNLMKYLPESVGGVMTTRIPVFTVGMKVNDVLNEYVRRNMIGYYDRHNYIYIVNTEHKLIGCIEVKTLLTLPRNRNIEEYVVKPIAKLHPNIDREEAARLAVKYDLPEIPVVDENDRLLGIITMDDLLDIAVYELTEDLLKIGGFFETVRTSYMGASIKSLVVRRVPPILFLYIMNAITGSIVASFIGVIERIAILASFLTMLADNSGNIGSQASSIIIRSLALGDVKPRDLFRVLSKETVITIFMASILLPIGFTISFSITYFIYNRLDTSLIVGLAVASALFVSMLTADLIGAVLPIILARLKLDPAAVSAPLITTIGDIITALIYFLTASLLIKIYGF